MKKQPLLLMLAFSITLIIQSCSLVDSDAPEPIFLEIPSVEVFAENGQGAPTHKITDVWINYNGLLGVYPLPARIPIIPKDGETSLDINILPGIRNNGQTSVPFIYKLMDGENITLEAVPGKVYTETIIFNYAENAIFDFVESFEGNHIFLDKGPNNVGNGGLTTTSAEAKEGQRAGHLQPNMESNIIEVLTSVPFNRSENGGGDSYLELDYKSDIPFFVGIYIKTATSEISVYNVLIAEKEDWNKIYLDFTLDILNPSVQEYRVAILASLEGSTKSEGNVYVDNIKFVHF